MVAEYILAISILVCPLGGMSSGTNEDPEPRPGLWELPLEELFKIEVVTAQKRTESSQEVAISMEILSNDRLSKAGIFDLRDLGAIANGLTIQPHTGEYDPRITIRGIGIQTADNQSPSAAVHFDEVFLISPAMMAVPIFDIERVEILKGPQSTLYGRNSTAGSINFVTARPSFAKGGYVDLEYGRYNQLVLNAATGGPLSESVAGRLAFHYNMSDGHQELLGTAEATGFTPEPGIIPGQPLVKPDSDFAGKEKVGLRGSLLVTPNAKLDITLAGHWYKDRSEVAKYKTFAPDAFGFGGGTSDPFTVLGDEADDQMDAVMLGGVVTVNYELDSAMFTSNTGYESFTRDFTDPNDGSPLPLVVQIFDETQKTLQQELRMASKSGGLFGWILGINYAYEDIDWAKDVPFLLARTDVFTAYRKKGNGYAVFGQVDYQLTDQLKVIAGSRLLEDKREIVWSVSEDRDPYGISARADHDLPITDLERSISQRKLLWKAGLNWTPMEDTLIYVSISTGFKSGGFDGSFISSLPETEPFAGEDITAYEVGYKATFLGSSLRIGGSLFYYDYRNLQATRIVTTTLSNGAISSTGVLDTAGDAAVKGGDLQVDWLPIEGLRMNFGMTLLDTEILSFESDSQSEIDAVVGNPIPGAPDYKINGLASYGWPVAVAARDMRLEAILDIRAQDSFATELHDLSFLKVEDYAVANLRIDLSPDDRRWAFGIWVRNLTDEQYAISKFPEQGQGNVARQVFASPRTFGVNWRYRWSE